MTPPDFDWPFHTMPEDEPEEERQEPLPIELEGFKKKPEPALLPCPFCGGPAEVQRFEADPESCTGFFGSPTYRGVCLNAPPAAHSGQFMTTLHGSRIDEAQRARGGMNESFNGS